MIKPDALSTELSVFPSEDLVMIIYLQLFFLLHLFKKTSCQLIEKKITLSTGKLPWGGLPRNSVVRICDRLDITTARNQTKQEQNYQLLLR